MAKKKLIRVKFLDAVDEFNYEMQAMKRSEFTIKDYNIAYSHFSRLVGNPFLHEVDKPMVVRFFHQLASETSTPDGAAPRPSRKRSNKTIYNYYTGLSAMWTWAVEMCYAKEHVIRQYTPPKPEEKEIIPYTDEETVNMVKCCEAGKPWKRKPLTQTERVTSERDQAIILTLLDTGVRNTELRCMKVEHIDWTNKRISIPKGKGGKSRIVGFGPTTAKYLRRWLHLRPEVAKRCGDYVFVNMIRYKGHQMRSDALNRLIKRIARRAGVSDANVHRFRHTCAIRRLQNGMNVFELQKLMGHSDLKTTRRYVYIAQLDMDDAMRISSPVDSLRV